MNETDNMPTVKLLILDDEPDWVRDRFDLLHDAWADRFHEKLDVALFKDVTEESTGTNEKDPLNPLDNYA
jgi:hypothetical protein